MAIQITVGDTVSWKFTAKVNGVAVDLTGATIVTRVKKSGSGEVTFTSDMHTVDPDQVAHKGKFTVNPTEELSLQLRIEDNQETLHHVTQGGKVYTIRGTDALTVLANKV